MNRTEQIKAETYNSIIYKAVIDFLRAEHSVDELKDARKSVLTNSRLYKDVQRQLIIFIDAFIFKHEKAAREALICRPTAWKALEFNLTGLERVERKISQIKDVKTQNAFVGLFNLLADERNLVYNKLSTRQAVIDDLNKFKTLKFFKVAYVSAFDLKKAFRFLAVKADAQRFHSKLYMMEHGLYVLKTVETDGITLKAFYIHNKINNLLEKGGRAANLKKAVPRGDKFNLSSVDAWKSLEKEDNIRFYGYCNKAGLNKGNRTLLRDIRRMAGGETFSCHLEQVEERLALLEADYDDLAEIVVKGVKIKNYAYLDELEEARIEYWRLTEEHNSDEVPTELGDYKW